MDRTYLELTDGASHKFYEVSVDDQTLTVRYGRIGDAGQSSTKTFETPQQAQAEAQKKLAEKRKSGYAEAMQGEREKIAVPKPARVPKLQIVGFTETTEPITEAITKFGGQPVWLEEPRWPLCPKNGKLIPFLGQIRLEPAIFGEIEAKMAYIFLGSDDPGGADGWPTDHGDSAVVLQPGNRVFTGLYDGDSSASDYIVQATGPTTTKSNSSVSVECAVQTQLGSDPTSYDFVQDDSGDEYCIQGRGHKIGGTPNPWGGDIHINDSERRLLQMESIDETDTPIPFGVYYGDGGCGWWVISSDGKRVWYTSMCG